MVVRLATPPIINIILGAVRRQVSLSCMTIFLTCVFRHKLNARMFGHTLHSIPAAHVLQLKAPQALELIQKKRKLLLKLL
jgi:hypothetical protein